jgi:hypothetical protein
MSRARAAPETQSRRGRPTSRRKAALVAQYIRELSARAGAGSTRRSRPGSPANAAYSEAA